MLGLSFQELLIVGAVAVMLFGKRLPDVARSLGAQYRELRKGLSELQSQVDFSDTVYRSPRPSSSGPNYDNPVEADDFDEPTAPKLELPVRQDDQATS